MSRKIYIIIGAILLAGLVGGGIYWAVQNQQSKYVNFKDPKFTNEEIANIEGKIKELEGAVKNKEDLGGLDNQEKKEDLFKLKMELASFYRLRGRLLDAKKLIQDSVDLKPDDLVVWNELFVVDQLREDYYSAENDLKKSLEINPANPQVWRWYFDLASGPLKYTPDQQRNLFKDALAKTNDHVDIITVYAGFLESTNDLAGAVAQWKLAIEKNPAGSSQYQAEIARIQNRLK